MKRFGRKISSSWVLAVGDDSLAAIPRTVGSGQTLIAQAFDSGGNTYWLQAAGSPTPLPLAFDLNPISTTRTRCALTRVSVSMGQGSL